MTIKLNTTKETFERTLYKNGYNIKVSLFDQFIPNLKRAILFNIKKSIEDNIFKETLSDIFGEKNIDKVSPLIIVDKEEIDFISIKHLIYILDQGIFDSFVENRIDREIKEENIQMFYKHYLYSDLQNKSKYNFKLKKINSKAYYTFVKNISTHISQISKEETEKSIINEFLTDIKRYHLSADYFSNINILGYSLSIDDFDNYLKKILIDYNMFEKGIETISFENDYRLVGIDHAINRLVDYVVYIRKEDILELIKLINANEEYRDKESFKMIENSHRNVELLFNIAEDINSFEFDVEFNSFNINGNKTSFSIKDIIDFKNEK